MHEAEAVESAPEGGVEQDFHPAMARRRRRGSRIRSPGTDAKSQLNQRWFKRLKICQIVTAAAIPVAASAAAPVGLIGGGGALIVVLEGLQQLQQYQQNWTTYRATCERLKHEKYLFTAGAGPYAAVARPEGLLAERVESLVSQEHAAWVSNRDEGAEAEERYA